MPAKHWRQGYGTASIIAYCCFKSQVKKRSEWYFSEQRFGRGKL